MFKWLKAENLKHHIPLLLILLLYLLLSIAYSSLVPLGEVPDEPAHLNYARFIAERGRLPANLAEREAAGYRSAWPPLYHFLVSRPLAAVGDTPPTHLKSVGDTPRRLIPTNGQTIAAFIHTEDETWPWQGIILAWHLGRFISVALTALTVVLTYAIAWRLTRQRWLATGAAALVAFIPQVLFIGSAVNDDNLLMMLSALIFFTLIMYTQRPTLPSIPQVFLLGMLLGLASVTKYNALPLWVIVFTWLGWMLLRPSTRPAESSKPQSRFGRIFTAWLSRLAALLLGAVFTGGWWFIFIWRNFNQVDELGLLPGSLAMLTAGTADASLQELTAGPVVTIPPVAAWLAWSSTFFKSFWGLFGGGGTIELPGWVYWVLFAFCLLAIISYLVSVSRSRSTVPHPTLLILFLLTPLFFLILPLVRFILTGGNIIETAQGRHLFPALPAIVLVLIWGLSQFKIDLHCTQHLRRDRQGEQGQVDAMRRVSYLTIILLLFTFLLSAYALFLIHRSYPPLIPLRTTSDAVSVENILNTKLTESITLVGHELDQAREGVLPLTLVWQANAIPNEDYLVDLTLTDSTGQFLGGWLGHPVGGRYPTRAWDKGDILRDTIPIPLLPGSLPGNAILRLQLRDTRNQATTEPLTLTTELMLPPTQLSAATTPLLPPALRADGLSPVAPFTYRSTLNFVLPGLTIPPELSDAFGQTFPPTHFIPGPNGSIANFIVEANWPSGDYQLSEVPGSTFTVQNRQRQFDAPAMDHVVNANFADHITLLGYDLPQQRVQPGERLPITLHLRAERPIGHNLVIFNHLLDQVAVQRGGEDRVPLEYYTTLLWIPGEIVSDAYHVPVEATAPPGVYWLDVGFYPAEQPEFSLPLFIDDQPIDRNSVRLGPIKVGGPPPGITTTGIQPQHPTGNILGDQVTLLGFNLTGANGTLLDTSQPVPPNLQLILYWQAQRIPDADYTVFVHLFDPSGNLVAQFDGPPAGGTYPTSLWDPGEIIVDERLFSNLPPGHYTLQIGLYQPDRGERLSVGGSPDGTITLGEFQVKP